MGNGEGKEGRQQGKDESREKIRRGEREKRKGGKKKKRKRQTRIEIDGKGGG